MINKSTILLLIYNTLSIGIDMGSYYYKAGYYHPKKRFQMIEDKISRRKSPSVFAFCYQKRFFEQQAISKIHKNDCVFISYLNMLLGYDKEEFQRQLDTSMKIRNVNDIIYMDIPQNSLPFQTGNEIFSFKFEEVYSMMLKDIKENAEKQVSQEEYIFCLWDDISLKNKKKIQIAMELADMKLNRFINVISGAAIYHGLTFFSQNQNFDESILIIDLGEMGVKFGLVKIFNQYELSKQQLEIELLKNKFYDTFSGQKITNCFINLLIQKFNTKENLQIILENLSRKNIEILFTVNKQIEILSTNHETVVKIDDFFEGHSLNEKINREEFINFCSQQFIHLKEIIYDFQSLIQEYSFSRIELIGGLCRIPQVKQIIEQFYQKPVGQHINGDEAPALGASALLFFTMNKTTTTINLREKSSSVFTYNLMLNENFESENILFTKDNYYGDEQDITIVNVYKDFSIQIKERKQNWQKIYQIQGINEIKEKTIYQSKLIVKFRLSFLGELEIINAIYYLNKIENWEKYQLMVNSQYQEDLQQSKQLIKQFDEFENDLKEKVSIKDQLEGILYKLQDEQEQEISEIKLEIEQILYSEDSSSSLKDLKSLLQKSMSFIKVNKSEHQIQQENSFENLISDFKKEINFIKKKMNEEQFQKILKPQIHNSFMSVLQQVFENLNIETLKRSEIEKEFQHIKNISTYIQINKEIKKVSELVREYLNWKNLK